MMPTVSIGLPVYNGTKYLPAQVESLLAQTMTDFELLLLDNASTDGTTEMCAEYARRDRRVRHVRNPTNIGGGPNFNRAFDLSTRAPYFKWAAHDDVHGPRFLEACVEALEKDSTAVVAFTKASFIDDEGNVTGHRELTLPLSSPDVATRFEAMLPTYDCLEIFGVIRRDVLVGNPMGLYKDGDGVLLTRLALQGRFLEVPEPGFLNRRHVQQTTTLYARDHRGWATWWDPANQGKRVFPAWRRNAELWRALLEIPLSRTEKFRCATALTLWIKARRHRLYDDVNFHVKDILENRGKRD